MSAQQQAGRGDWDCSIMSTRVGVLVSAVFFVAVGIASADSPSTPRLSTDELVGEALDREIHARDEQRNTLLASALKQDPEHPQARWHSGYVRYRDEWVPFDTLATSIRTDPAYEKYLDIRKRFPDTATNHRKLAKWCVNLKLPELSQTHQFMANQRALEALRNRRMFGDSRSSWVLGRNSSDSQNQASEKALDSKQLSKWRKKLIQLAEELSDPTTEIRDRALARFQEYEPTEIALAIEGLVDQLPEKRSATLVTALGSLPEKDVDHSLLRIAVLSKSGAVRTAAIEPLKSRPKDASISILLSGLKTPFTEPNFRSDSRSLRSPKQVVFRRECFDIQEEFIFEIHGDVERLVWSNNPRSVPVVAEVITWSERQNRQTQQRNERIYGALQQLTGKQVPDTPQACWSWWDEKSDSMSTEKPTVQTYHYRTIRRPPQPFRLPGGACSCFAEGTPVVTFEGLRPIEKIQPGELVLSQDIETGQLTYRPVLRTTVRRPTRLLNVSADAESFNCTGNHAFWVPGKGWVPAKRLKSGAAIHRVRGTSLIGSIEYSQVQEAYNLVVHDFHTYFIGKQGILVHDVTPAPTSTTDVPGWRRP